MNCRLTASFTAIALTLGAIVIPDRAGAEPATTRLTEAQIQQVSGIRRQGNAEILELYKKLLPAQQELNDLLSSATATEEQVQRKYAEVKALMQQVADKEFETRLAIRAVLPPELRLPFAQRFNEIYQRTLQKTPKPQ